MKLQIYQRIIAKYRQLKGLSCLEELSSSFPEVPFESLENIVFQEFQRKTIKSHFTHKTPERKEFYYKEYLNGVQQNKRCGFLVELAQKYEIAPSSLARIILEQHYGLTTPESESSLKNKTNDLCKNTSLIEDARLASEVHLCVLNDQYYGPITDVIRRAIGLEYEDKLKRELKTLGLTFMDEVALREKGYDKTPDIILEVPIGLNGQVINWIESKASFGDEYRHNDYLKKQYWSYCNRFGPGLVIYWFDFIEELHVHKEHGIHLSDHLPNNFTMMKPLSIMRNAL